MQSINGIFDLLDKPSSVQFLFPKLLVLVDETNFQKDQVFCNIREEKKINKHGFVRCHKCQKYNLMVLSSVLDLNQLTKRRLISPLKCPNPTD